MMIHRYGCIYTVVTDGHTMSSLSVLSYSTLSFLVVFSFCCSLLA
jgi:hypothetical protein